MSAAKIHKHAQSHLKSVVRISELSTLEINLVGAFRRQEADMQLYSSDLMERLARNKHNESDAPVLRLIVGGAA
jgi:hypothetical protein